MNSNQKTRKAKAGLLLIASPRFKTLGEGLRRGTYAQRKDADVKKILATMGFLDVEFPGIVYDKQEAMDAMDHFYMEKVDFVIAEFLSWSEDFAWIRFLRDMPEVRSSSSTSPKTMFRSATRWTRTTSSTTSVPGRSSARSKPPDRCPARDAGT